MKARHGGGRNWTMITEFSVNFLPVKWKESTVYDVVYWLKEMIDVCQEWKFSEVNIFKRNLSCSCVFANKFIEIQLTHLECTLGWFFIKSQESYIHHHSQF